MPRAAVLACAALAIALASPGQSDAQPLVHADAGRPIWSGVSAGIRFVWSSADLTARRESDGRTVFSVTERWRSERNADRKDPYTGGTPRCSGGNSLKLLSVVGPVASFRQESSGECEGPPGSWGVVRIVAVDAAREGIPANLADFFPEKDLLKALLADKRVQEALGSARPGPPPASLAALVERIAAYQSEDCRWAFSSDLLSRFAISSLERDRVVVQIGLSHGCEVARGTFTPIALRLAVPAAWREALVRAQQRQEGFLMGDAARLFGRRQTVWSFGGEAVGEEPVQARARGLLRTVAWGASGFAALSADGRLGLTSRGDALVHLWDLETGRELRAFRHEQVGVRALALGTGPAAGRSAAGLADGSIFLWDTATGAEGAVLRGHRRDVWAVAFSPDGRLLLSGGADGMVLLWDLATGREARAFAGHSHAVRAVAFADGGRLAVSASNDGTVRVWGAASGEPRYVLRGHEGGVWALAVSPDGLLLSGSEDRTAKVWDLGTGKERATFRAHRDRVRQVALSPEGGLAASADDTTLRIWNVATAREVAVVGRFGTPVTALRFAPSGATLMAGSEEGVQTWAVAEQR